VPARLEVIAGPMFSGKTEELIRRIERAHWGNKRVVVAKPRIDDRTTDSIAARAVEKGKSVLTKSHEAVIIQEIHALTEILEREQPDVFALDECQFFDDELVLWMREMLQVLRGQSIKFVAAGLDLDFRGLPYGAMPGLMALADSVAKLDAVCMQCGIDGARLTQRLYGSNETNVVGDYGQYEVRCRRCHTIPAL